MHSPDDGQDEGPDRDTLLKIYETARLIERCDDRIRATLRSGRMMAPHYPPRGQEVVSAAMATATRPEDYYVTIYRGLHDHLAKGVPLRELWAEYAGRATGSCRSRRSARTRASTPTRSSASRCCCS